MARAFFVLAVVLGGIAIGGTPEASANEVSDAHRASAAIDLIERAGSRLASNATSTEPSTIGAFGDVVATEAALEYFIGHAGSLLKGDVSGDLQALANALEELKALKDAKAAFLGKLGPDAQDRAFARAAAAGEQTVETARHIRTTLGCLDCEI